jgi:hypothetical protein
MKGRKIVFALAVVIPPFAIAFATRDVLLLVSITGSYAGLGIMWIIPACMVIFARRYCIFFFRFYTVVDIFQKNSSLGSRIKESTSINILSPILALAYIYIIWCCNFSYYF